MANPAEAGRARPPQEKGRPTPPWTTIVAASLLFLSCLPSAAAGPEVARTDPISVEAAFLRNFAHYVTWPQAAFADSHSPWRICVVGDDPFGGVLENTVRGRTEQGRGFEILRAGTLAELPLCQIVFVAYRTGANRRAALAELKNRPILTVGDAPGFFDEGGIIRFDVADYVKMSVNLDQARAVSLTIQTRMLEVSSEVMENGVVRKVR